MNNLKNALEEHQATYYREYVQLLRDRLDGVSIDLDRLLHVSSLLLKTPKDVESDCDLLNRWLRFVQVYPQIKQLTSKRSIAQKRLKTVVAPYYDQIDKIDQKSQGIRFPTKAESQQRQALVQEAHEKREALEKESESLRLQLAKIEVRRVSPQQVWDRLRIGKEGVEL